MHASNSIIKFADDTTVVGSITNYDETAYKEEVRALSVCQENNLTFNVSKTKEMIVETAVGAPPYPHRLDSSGEGSKF